MDAETRMNWINVRIDEIKDALDSVEQEHDPNDWLRVQLELYAEWDALTDEWMSLQDGE